MMEMMRSVSKRAFVKDLQQLIPEVTEDDWVSTNSGVRVQAFMPDGILADDFLIVNGRNSMHVYNAPSPRRQPHLKSDVSIANHLPEVTSARRRYSYFR